MDNLWAEQHGISAIYLHGSRVEGRAGEESDLDVAVLLRHEPEGWQQLEDLRAELELRLSQDLDIESDRLDVVFLHQAPPAFCYRAIKPGRIHWEADNHFRVHFEARLMAEYLDDQYYDEIHDRAMRQRLKEGTFGHRPAIRQQTAG